MRQIPDGVRAMRDGDQNENELAELGALTDWGWCCLGRGDNAVAVIP